MVEIPMTQGYVALIDEVDIPLVIEHKWYPQIKKLKTRQTVYARTHLGILMHRMILNTSDGVEVDHIDGDGLNNRRENLRLASHVQNMANQSRPVGKLLRGVRKRGNRYAAYYGYRSRIYLGMFATEEEAARARDNFALREYGEFATLTFALKAHAQQRQMKEVK